MGFGKIIHHPSVKTSEEGLCFIASVLLSQIVLKAAYGLFVQNGLFKGLVIIKCWAIENVGFVLNAL